MPNFIPRPRSDAEFADKMENGWCVGYPPADYKGSVANWCVAMGQRGCPKDYAELTDIMVPDAIWWAVLEECEGVPDGEFEAATPI